MTRSGWQVIAVFLGGLALGGALVALLLRGSGDGFAASSASTVPGGTESTTPQQASPFPVPIRTSVQSTSEAPTRSAAQLPGQDTSDKSSTVGETPTQAPGPQGPGQGASQGPGASPPAPRPSVSAPPRNIPCQVAVLPGPAPAMDNIRLVITTDAATTLVWATVEQNGRKVNGAIAIAGGRGEQVVDGYTQAARVIVYAEPSLDPATASCRAP